MWMILASVCHASALPYSDSHGRFFWHAAAAAYCEDALLKPWTCSQCAAMHTNVSSMTIFDDPQTDARGYVGVIDDAHTFGLPQRAILVAFRGSSTLINWSMHAAARTPTE